MGWVQWLMLVITANYKEKEIGSIIQFEASWKKSY
jgi:hypothetical protein